MPRINIWLDDEQDAQITRHFGKGSNRSGAIRAALAVLFATIDRDHRGLVARESTALVKLEALIERAEAQLTPAARRRAKGGGKS